jgi:hypothetical protein
VPATAAPVATAAVAAGRAPRKSRRA